MTRHGLDHTRAAAIALRPMAHLVPNVVNCDPRLSFNHHSSTRNRAHRAPILQRDHPPDMQRRRSNRSPHRPKIEFPIDQCLLTAGSFIQRLSYASGARNSSGKQTVRLRAVIAKNVTFGAPPADQFAPDFLHQPSY